MKKRLFMFCISLFACLIVMTSRVYCQAPDWLWARSAGDNSYDDAYSVAVDAEGNSYVAGYYNTYIFDLPHSSSADIFFVKYNPDGHLIWTRSLSSSGADKLFAIRLDKLGHLYIAGYFEGNVLKVGGDSIFNSAVNKFDIFIAKYDTAGTWIWTRQVTGTGEDYPTGMAVDSVGNCYLTGYFDSPTLTFGTHTLTNTGSVDLFAVKYDADGTALWARSGKSAGTEISRSVSVDGEGNCFVTGEFNDDSLTFGTILLRNIGSQDIFVAKYSPDGNVLWAKNEGSASDAHAYSVTTDIFENAIVAGTFRSSMIVGTTTLTSAGNVDIALVKYLPDGTVSWAESFGGVLEDQGSGVATDNLGYIYLSGFYKSDSMTMGTYTLNNNSNSGFSDIYASVLNLSGNVLWAKSVGGMTNDYPNDIQSDLLRNIYIAGCLGSASMVVGNDTLLNEGTTDMMLLKSLNSPPEGIIDNKSAAGFSLFPVPAGSNITVVLSEISDVEIHTLQGQLCLSRKSVNGHVNLSVANLQEGFYILSVGNEHGQSSRKFVICR